MVTAGGEAATLFAEGRPSSCSAPPGSPEGAGTPAPAAAFPSAQSGRGTLTWVVVVPFHDADVHGGGRLRHRRSLPLRRVALHAAPLHRLQEPKAAAGSACGAGTPPAGQRRPRFPSPCPPLRVTQQKPSTGKRERPRSPGRAPIIAARIPVSALGFPTSPGRSHAPHDSLTISSILLNCGGGPVPTCIWLGMPAEESKLVIMGRYGLRFANSRLAGPRHCQRAPASTGPDIAARHGRSSACTTENPTTTSSLGNFQYFSRNQKLLCHCTVIHAARCLKPS